MLIFILNVNLFTNSSIPSGNLTTPRFDMIIVCFVWVETALPNFVKKVFKPTGSIFMSGFVE